MPLMDLASKSEECNKLISVVISLFNRAHPPSSERSSGNKTGMSNVIMNVFSDTSFHVGEITITYLHVPGRVIN